MCNIDRRTQQQIMAMGLSIISKAMEASLSANQPQTTTDVLGTATTAYQQGKITKTQLMGVINALDEQIYQTQAYAEPTGNTWNQEYLEANAYLNQYRR